jgi:flagellar FliL protein
MAAPKPEAPRAEQEKPGAEAAAKPAAGGAAPGGAAWKAWLPLIVAVVAMPVLAYFTTTLVLVPKMVKATEAPGAHSAEPKAAGHGSAKASSGHGSSHGSSHGAAKAGERPTVALNKLLVNVAGTMGSRYLLTSLTLVGDGDDFPGMISRNEPQLRDMASGVLSMKTISDLEKPGARNLLRGELLAGFNSILGNNAVQEIYFTDFAIQ